MFSTPFTLLMPSYLQISSKLNLYMLFYFNLFLTGSIYNHPQASYYISTYSIIHPISSLSKNCWIVIVETGL